MPDADRLTGQADQPLDVIGLRFAGIFEDRNVPAARFVEFEGELADQDAIAAIGRILAGRRAFADRRWSW